MNISEYFVFNPIRHLIVSLGDSFVASLPKQTLRLLDISVDSESLSLTDAQEPDKQLRFFQQERVQRLLVDLTVRLNRELNSRYVTLYLTGKPKFKESPILKFFIENLNFRSIPFQWRDSQVEEIFLEKKDLHRYVLSRLSVGDIWTVEEILKKLPQDIESVELERLRALCLALQHKTNEAEIHFKRWFKMASPINQAWSLYSQAMLYARHHSAQKQSLEKACDLLEQAYEILNSKSKPDTERDFTRVFNRNGYALILFRRGEVQHAINLLNQCIREIPEGDFHLRLHKSVLFYNLAQCHLAKEDLIAAKLAFQTLVELDPNYAENRIEFAKLLIDQERWTDAEEHLQVAVNSDPCLPIGWQLFGVTLLKLKKYSNAVKALEYASDLVPLDRSVTLDLVEAYLGASMLMEAEKKLETMDPKILEQQTPELIENYYVFRAELACQRREPEVASRVLLEGLNRIPDSQCLRENLALC